MRGEYAWSMSARNAAAELLDRHVAAGRGERIAYHDDRTSLTYAALRDRAGRAGNALRALGLEPEQRVAMVMLDTIDFPAMFLGAMRAGIVPVPLNTLLPAADYVYLLDDSRARVLVVSEALLGKLEPAIAASPYLRHVVVAGEASGRARLDDLLAAASPQLDAAPTSADDIFPA